MSDPPIIGYTIKEELEERGWSERDLADMMNVDEQVINEIISGDQKIDLPMSNLLAIAFGVDGDFFIRLQDYESR